MRCCGVLPRGCTKQWRRQGKRVRQQEKRDTGRQQRANGRARIPMDVQWKHVQSTSREHGRSATFTPAPSWTGEGKGTIVEPASVHQWIHVGQSRLFNNNRSTSIEAALSTPKGGYAIGSDRGQLAV